MHGNFERDCTSGGHMSLSARWGIWNHPVGIILIVSIVHIDFDVPLHAFLAIVLLKALWVNSSLKYFK